MELEYIMRYVLCILAIAVIINCVWSLVRLKPDKKVYALLVDMANDTQYPINCYETSVGRSRWCDIVFTNSTVSRSHAVVALRKDGFYVFDTESKTGVYVNNEKIVKKQKLQDGDIIAFGLGRFVLFHPICNFDTVALFCTLGLIVTAVGIDLTRIGVGNNRIVVQSFIQHRVRNTTDIISFIIIMSEQRSPLTNLPSLRCVLNGNMGAPSESSASASALMRKSSCQVGKSTLPSPPPRYFF